MELGIKDIYVSGESPDWKLLHVVDSSSKQDAVARERERRKRQLEMKDKEQNRTILARRCYKISNHLLKNVDKQLWDHF
jgi:hypothetical protein